jgi:alpha-tubulin suppressor-like RCC1 family protein
MKGYFVTSRCSVTKLAKLTMTMLFCIETDVASAATAAADRPLTTVFSFGRNIGSQTGHGTNGNTLVATPIDLSNLEGRTIKQIEAGGEATAYAGHSLLLTNDGAVFSFGSNAYGQTGRGTMTGDTLLPMAIHNANLAGKQIVQIAAGARHSLLLAADGSVFSFGQNATAATGFGTTEGNTSIATSISTVNLAGVKIAQIATDDWHSLLLANDGTVYAFGWNFNGQTGVGYSGDDVLVATPIVVANLAGKKMKQIAAGEAHSLLLAEDGSVFAFGANENGKTGLGASIGNTLLATPIDAQNLAGLRITQIAASDDHSLLLAEDGTVFSCGLNFFGQTGLGTSVGDTLIPTRIDDSNFAGRRIVQVSAGETHSLLLADDGTVFSFGYNGYGLTGLGIEDGNTLIAAAIETTHLQGLRVIGISAGGGHSLLLAVPIPEPSGATFVVTTAGLLMVLRRRPKHF